jgi:archaellum component FlaC
LIMRYAAMERFYDRMEAREAEIENAIEKLEVAQDNAKNEKQAQAMRAEIENLLESLDEVNRERADYSAENYDSGFEAWEAGF